MITVAETCNEVASLDFAKTRLVQIPEQTWRSGTHRNDVARINSDKVNRRGGNSDQYRRTTVASQCDMADWLLMSVA